MNPYDTLGVDQKADHVAVRKAYRRRAQKVHPDKNGGKPSEEFFAIQRAYEILSDPERRARFDASGQDEGSSNPLDQSMGLIAQILLSMVDAVDVDGVNLCDAVQQTLERALREADQEIVQAKSKITRREKAVKRMKRKKVGDNLLASVLQGDIRRINQIIAATEVKRALFVQALAIVKEYGYDVELFKGPQGLRMDMCTFTSQTSTKGFSW